MLHRCTKIFTLAFLILSIALGGILGWHFLSAQADQTYELGGWYWSGNYGWIALNSGNAELANDPINNAIRYKVIVTDGALSGWGWSANVGWVCFGVTCNHDNICNGQPLDVCNPDASYNSPLNPGFNASYAPPGAYQASIDNSTHRITGWAKIIALKDSGWLHLGMGIEVPPPVSPDKLEQCYDCQPECVAWNYDSAVPPVAISCKTYSTTNYSGCKSCFTRTKFDNANIPDAGVESVVGGSGNTCFQCVTCNRVMSTDRINSRITCASCATCYLYGGASDSSNGGSLGWGWNGNNDGSGGLGKDGAGWVQLNPSGLVFPWLQTQYGTVFGTTVFRQKAVVSGINATYCIFAQDILNFRSQNCAGNIPGVNIGFPVKNNADQSYKNALGRLDVTGLSTAVKTIGGHKYNKYGNIIIEATGNQSWNQFKVFDNQVFIIRPTSPGSPTSLIIDDGFFVQNGEAGQKGNGLVIVDGDLKIYSDFYYDNDPVSEADLKRLASVAWLVKGDIIIEPAVKNAVGVFIALGRDGSACQYADDSPCSQQTDYPKFKQNGYGVFSSGVSAEPLVISGLLLAKAFNFERSYSDILQGSEKIIYDGRLMANPPPGLKSLLEILPIIRDFEY